MKILGIDEAGKGPVIGPLVLCGALIPKDKIDTLKDINVRDSKVITPNKRVELAEEIKKLVNFKFIKLSAKDIDTNKQTGGNLNAFEIQHMADLINHFKPDTVYIDAIESNIMTFTSKVHTHLRIDTKIIAEHKADATYPIVSAASILAKVERDADIEKLKEEYGNFGSGYPADPTTKKFLKDWIKANKALPPIVRHTWGTITGLTQEKKQKNLEEFI